METSFQVRYVQGEPHEKPLIYINNIQISASQFDIQIRLNRLVSIDDDKKEALVINEGTLAMSPQHAASMVELMAQQLAFYRQTYGDDGSSSSDS